MKTAMSRYHLGLRGRLFSAFGVVAALTVLASSSAIISYDSLGRSLGAIACLVPSARSLSATVSFGAPNGSTSTACILSIGRNLLHLRSKAGENNGP